MTAIAKPHITDDPVERLLVSWVERTLGGQVVSIERQNRWRPGWFLDVERGAETLSLYVRGDRTSKSIMFPLEYEYRVLQVLEANGILVPHLYGLCPDPLSIVMAKVSGRPDLSTAATDDERRSVLDHYIEQLAAIHRIDVGAFEAAGIERPEGAAGIALNLFKGFEAMYRETKRRPEPVQEFLIRWVHRNVPQHRNRVSIVCADPGQFLFQDGHVTTLLDFELAYLGDSMHDLAGLSMRDTTEPLGDLGRALRHYMALTGETIDEEAFDFHTIQWSVGSSISMTDNVTQPLPTGALLQYFEWYIHLARMPLEIMARRAGIALPPLSPPVPRPARLGTMAEGLAAAIRGIPVADSFESYERDSAAKLATYLHDVGEFGPEFERQDIADVNDLLGSRFDPWQQAEADAALETFVLGAGPEHDRVLIPLMYRRIQRQVALLVPFLSRDTVAQSLKSLGELLGTGT